MNHSNIKHSDLLKEIEQLTDHLLKVEPDVMTSLERYILRRFLTILGREKEMPKFTGSALTDRGINEMEWIAQRQKQREEKPPRKGMKPKKKKPEPTPKPTDGTVVG